MTYRAMVAPALRAALGMPADSPEGPCIICDGCGETRTVVTRSGMPAQWFMNGKNAPGWLLVRAEEPFHREDYCPKCKTGRKLPKGPAK